MGDTLGTIIAGALSGTGVIFLRLLYTMLKDRKHGAEQQRRREIDHMAAQLEAAQAALVTARNERDAAVGRADGMAQRAMRAEEEASRLRRVIFDNGFTLPAWLEDTWEMRRDRD